MKCTGPVNIVKFAKGVCNDDLSHLGGGIIQLLFSLAQRSTSFDVVITLF
jgi:hypothetical protein